VSVRTTSGEHVAALFDSVTGRAFGPVFDTDEQVDDFLRFTASGPDLQTMSHDGLSETHAAWLKAWQERGNR
jgi:hypothetical protein